MTLGLGIAGIAGGVRALQVVAIPDPPVAAVFSRPPPRPVYTQQATTAPQTTAPQTTTAQTTTAQTTTLPVPAQTTTLSAPVSAPAPADTAPPPPVYTSPQAPPSRKATITPPAPPLTHASTHASTHAPAHAPAPPPRSAAAPVVRPEAARPAPAPARPAALAGPQGARIAAYARELASTQPQIPYMWAGKTPAGFDCSGFIFYVLHHLGITDTYRDSGALAAWATHVSANEAKPGDLAYWPGHVAIFLGDGMMADAGNTRVDVSVRPLRVGASFARVPA